MRLGKRRGPYSDDAMPMGPHRTRTVPVNVGDLERFEAGTEATVELLAERVSSEHEDRRQGPRQGELTKK